MVVGVLGVAAVGFFVVRAVTGGSGGASSPEAAVEDLAAALEEEDPVAALATMNPDEVEALGDVYESAAERAGAIGFAPEADALGGVDIALSGLRYDVDELGDGVAKVTVSGGADVTVTRDELGDQTDAVIERQAEADGEEADSRFEGELEDSDLVVTDDDGDEVDPFVVTVRRDGGWYVSPLHTAAQYGVEALGLDSPSFPPSEDGEAAEDPEAAVRALLEAAGAADGAATGGLVGGETGEAARSYSGALEGLVGELGEDTEAEVTELETEVSEREAGGQRVTITRLEGTLTYTDEDEGEQVAQVVWDGRCLDVTEEDSDAEGDTMSEDEEELDVGSSHFCLTDGWERVGIDSLSVVAVEEEGGWRIDPLATLTDYAAEVVPELGEDTILRLVDHPELAEPTAALEAGTATDVDLNEAGFAVATLEATAGDPFTISSELPDDVDDELQAFLVAPDGSTRSAFSLVEPEESGEYLLVLGKDGFSPGTASVRVSNLSRRELAVGTEAPGEIAQPGDIIEYSVDLEADTEYVVTFDDPELAFSVIDPDGLALDPTTSDDDSSSFTTTDSGTHALRVEGGTDEATGSFRIGLREQPPFVLGNGSSAEATGAILAPTDSQFIDLTVQGGRDVVVDIVADGGALDPVFIVVDPDTDVEIERFNSGGPGQGESVRFSPPETTTFRIEVQSAGGTTGAYTARAREEA